MHRYRDNVPEIQEDVLRALSRWICFSPFAMLRDKYASWPRSPLPMHVGDEALRGLFFFSSRFPSRRRYIKYFGWVLSFDTRGGGAADAARGTRRPS